MNYFSTSFAWLLAVILLVAGTGQKMIAAEPDEKPGQEATPKWEGEYPQLPIEKVTREEFDAGWQIDLSVNDKPLGEVLETIIQGEKDWQAEISPNEILKKKISLSLKKVSRLEAIELACREVGFHPEYESSRESDRFDNLSEQLKDVPRELWLEFIQNRHKDSNNNTQRPGVITLHPGKYPQVKGLGSAKEPYPSVTFAGPVRIQLTELQENAPLATGEVELRFQWLPLPKHVGPDSNHEPAEMNWQIGEVIGPDGENLVPKEKSKIQGSGIYGEGGRSHLKSRTKRMSLKGLVRGVDKIEMLFCHIHFYLPVEWKPIWFEYPRSGDKVTQDGYIATYGGQWYSDQLTGFMLDSIDYRSRHQLKQIRIFAFNDDGKSINPGVSLVSGKTSGRSLNYLQQTPALFVIVPITKSVDIAYSPAFKDILLSKHNQQPEQLIKLEYGDHDGPVSAENLERVERNGELVGEKGKVDFLQVKLTNHSNKPIQQIRVAFFKVDDQSKRIDLSSSYLYFQGGNGVTHSETLLEPGQTITDDAYHSDLPAKDVKLGMMVDHVIFTDRTAWEPKNKWGLNPPPGIFPRKAVGPEK